MCRGCHHGTPSTNNIARMTMSHALISNSVTLRTHRSPYTMSENHTVIAANMPMKVPIAAPTIITDKSFIQSKTSSLVT